PPVHSNAGATPPREQPSAVEVAMAVGRHRFTSRRLFTGVEGDRPALGPGVPTIDGGSPPDRVCGTGSNPYRDQLIAGDRHVGVAVSRQGGADPDVGADDLRSGVRGKGTAQ